MRLKTMCLLQELWYRLLSLYPATPQSPPTIYRLLEVKKTPTGQPRLIFKPIGRSIVVEHAPEELLANESLLDGFSKKDIRTITYLACEEEKKPRYKIVMQDFCEQVNRILFKLKKRDSTLVISKTAGQISLDKSLVNNLSQEDACCIGYVAGYEQSYLDRLPKD